jgi:hypothetical protein
LPAANEEKLTKGGGKLTKIRVLAVVGTRPKSCYLSPSPIVVYSIGQKILKRGTIVMGISQSLMMGVITAQSNIELARQNQGLANQRYLAGRIRVRQGLTDGNQDMIEEGQRLQAEGKEMEFGTFEHLGNAMHNINNINRSEYDECEDLYDENSQETQSVGDEQTDGESYGEFNVVVRGDAVRGSVNRNFSASRQSRVNVTV